MVAVLATVVAELDRRNVIDVDLASVGVALSIGTIAFVIGLVYTAIRQLRVRRALPPERYRGPSVFILLALALVVGLALTALFIADAEALESGEGELSLLGSAVILVAAQTGLLLVGYLFVYRPGALAALPSFPGNDPRGALVAGVGYGAVAWLGTNVVLYIMAALLTALGLPPETGPAEQAIAMLNPVLVVFAIVLFAPIAEELFFRGIVFNAWRREASRRWAYIGSAALFAVIHFQLVSLVPIFLLGLALAWVYERTRSLLAPIAMHATVNGLSVALALAVRFGGIELPVQ